MIEFFNTFYRELIITGIMTLSLTIIRYITILLIKKYAIKSEVLEYRKNLVIKYISVFFTTLFFVI